MKILIVNDDSISAPGIALMAREAAKFADVWVVAPERQCSAMSQKLTLRELLTVERVRDFPARVRGAWRVGGTPVDCVKVALSYLLDEKPDYVFSGINNGFNAGYDIAYSGTVGAAFEAERLGIPAAAFSVASDAHLEAAAPYLPDVLREILRERPKAGCVWNVNFPALVKVPLKGILRHRIPAPTGMYQENYVEIPQPDGTLKLECRGIPTPDTLIPEGTDAAAVRAGYISIGQVSCLGW